MLSFLLRIQIHIYYNTKSYTVNKYGKIELSSCSLFFLFNRKSRHQKSFFPYFLNFFIIHQHNEGEINVIFSSNNSNTF